MFEQYYSVAHDPSALVSETNELRFRPCRGVLLRLDRADAADAELAAEAARVCGVPLHVSFSDEESEADLAARLRALADSVEFLRTVRLPGDMLLAASYDAGLNWINAAVLRNGYCELTRWLREQSVSETRHRYGLVQSPVR